MVLDAFKHRPEAGDERWAHGEQQHGLWRQMLVLNPGPPPVFWVGPRQALNVPGPWFPGL